jgi:hypothetical protein
VATDRPAVSEATLGAWLVKARPDALPVAEVVRTGFETITQRCVRPSYRTELIREGQPVLLWVSGRDRKHPAGVYAHGHTIGSVGFDGSELAMPVRLRAVEPAIRRDELLSLPGLAEIEVLRMPAGSNPSYLDREQYRALLEAFPQLSQGRSCGDCPPAVAVAAPGDAPPRLDP